MTRVDSSQIQFFADSSQNTKKKSQKYFLILIRKRNNTFKNIIKHIPYITK